MDFTMVIPVLIAFVLSVAAGPVVIPVLRRLKMDQTEREDGVKSHLKKAGTPTMGGVMILFAIAVTSLIYVREYPQEQKEMQVFILQQLPGGWQKKSVFLLDS